MTPDPTTLPLAISTSVFARVFTPAHVDALDASEITALEIVEIGRAHV